MQGPNFVCAERAMMLEEHRAVACVILAEAAPIVGETAHTCGGCTSCSSVHCVGGPQPQQDLMYSLHAQLMPVAGSQLFRCSAGQA